ncbi:hypothetical protein ABK040_004786 [Willaertia magna]
MKQIPISKCKETQQPSESNNNDRNKDFKIQSEIQNERSCSCKCCSKRMVHAEQYQYAFNPPKEPLRSELYNICCQPITKVNSQQFNEVNTPLPISTLSISKKEILSLRELPKVTFNDITKLCKYYQEKTQNKYSANTRAYRYLFELTNDIIKLIEKLKGENEREKSEQLREITDLNEICKEWNTYFNADKQNFYIQDKVYKENMFSKGLVTPKMVKEKMETLEKRVEELENQLKNEKLIHFEQERKLHQVINEQMELSKKGRLFIMK